MKQLGRSGRRGIVWNSANKKWVATLYHAGKTIYCGSFTNKLAAMAARQEVKRSLKQ